MWRVIASCLRAQRLAVRQRITNDDFRSPQVRLLLSPDDDPWVTHVDNGVKYSFDVTRCMFSAGNITEKIRISKMDCSQEVVLDLYAGIGYFTLPYLVHARAKFVHACEWNPEAAHALRRNLELNKMADRCRVHFGDNRNVKLVGAVQRVNLGLIPSSQPGWAVACRALDPATGGTLHVHSNLNVYGDREERSRAYEAEGRRVRDAVEGILRDTWTESGWNVTVQGVIKVLLVTSSRAPDRWIVPGGGLEPDEEPPAAAAREVMEEAGVRGEMGRCLGTFENSERKHRTSVFVLVVTEELEDWEDSKAIGRQRKWFPIGDALAHLFIHKPVQWSYVKLLSKNDRVP